MDNGVMDNVSDMSQAQIEPNSQLSEKMVPQSQVNEIVGNAKREAAERAVDAYKRQQSQYVPSSASQHQEPSSQRNVSEDDIKRVTGDEIKRHFNEIEQDAQERANVEAANRIVGKFRDKIVAGKDKFEDFRQRKENEKDESHRN